MSISRHINSNVYFFLFFFANISFQRLLRAYFVCAIGGQHDGHLPCCLPGFVKLINVKKLQFYNNV